MRNTLALLFIGLSLNLFSQKDSLQIGDTYLEDQLYFGITYNQLINQPFQVIRSGFSYGMNTGYVRDISLVKSGKLALGLGLGYAFNSLKHGYKVSKQNNDVLIEVDPNKSTTSALSLHSLEFPIELRWRTSTANKYKFWRIYTGVKLSYNLKSSIEDTTTSIPTTYNNFSRFNKFQYGLTFSGGYSTFNFNLYYGLSPLFKDVSIGTKSLNTKVIRIGILFYIL